MENIISRHRNLTVLVAVLFAQLVGLAVQVKRSSDAGTTRLIRLWAVSGITPIEEALVGTSHWVGYVWHDYFYLRGVRAENRQLQAEITQMRLEQTRMAQDASQARRLQSLLGFKEQFISETLAAQVISTTGSDFSRGVYIDKGSRDGVKPDMPVITPDGVVGKVLRSYPHSALVLEINDPSSGAGVILEKSRLQGILRGDSNRAGDTMLNNIMADEKIEPGEQVLTSGGDRIYPKGLKVGTVIDARPSGDGTFLHVRVKPSASLDRVEEVLVITKMEEKTPEAEPGAPVRAADILAERLPSVPAKPPEPTGAPGSSPAGKPGPGAAAPSAGAASATKAATMPGVEVTNPGAAAGKKPATAGAAATAPAANSGVKAATDNAKPLAAAPVKRPAAGVPVPAPAPIAAAAPKKPMAPAAEIPDPTATGEANRAQPENVPAVKKVVAPAGSASPAGEKTKTDEPQAKDTPR